MIASAEGHIPPGTVHAGVNVKGTDCMIALDRRLSPAVWLRETII